jgi:hypothetical protein
MNQARIDEGDWGRNPAVHELILQFARLFDVF